MLQSKCYAEFLHYYRLPSEVHNNKCQPREFAKNRSAIDISKARNCSYSETAKLLQLKTDARV